MKSLGYAFIQVRIARPENDPHGPPELLEPWNCVQTRSHCAQEIFIQSKECGTGARCSIELLIQQWNELISNVGVPEKPAHLPPIQAAENRMMEEPGNGPG